MTEKDSGLAGRMDDFEFVVVPKLKNTKPQPKKPAPKSLQNDTEGIMSV